MSKKKDNKEEFSYKPLAMLFLGVIIGIIFMMCIYHTENNSNWIKDKINVQCSADVKTKNIVLDDTNWYENINWLNYNCSGNVTISEHPNALYFSTSEYVGDSGELGICNIDYIEVKKSISYND